MTEVRQVQAKRRTAPRTVFYSVAAQWDNLGDIEIRDTALSWVLGSGRDVVAYSGVMPASYLSAFVTKDRVRWVSSPVQYQAILVWHVLRRRASIVFAPGPQVFGPKPKSLLKTLVNLANVTGVRLSGGAVLAAGRSLRGSGNLARFLESQVVRMFHLFVVRDTRSASVLGRHLRNAPDLAFAHRGTGLIEQRTVAVISLRHDRPVDREGLKTLVGVLKGRGLETKLLTQVQRDDSQHAELSSYLNVPALLWADKSHREQLALARDTYAAASVVISNRLHSLILGIQQGAAPIAVIDEGSDKLRSTLDPWVEFLSTDSTFSTTDRGGWADVEFGQVGEHLVDATARARDEITTVRRDFLKILAAKDGGVRRLET